MMFFFIGCKSDAELNEVSQEEVISRLKSKSYNQLGVKYVTAGLDSLSAADRELLNTGNASKIFFENAESVISRIEISELKEEDQFFEIMYRELQDHPLNYLDEVVVVHCNGIDRIKEAYRIDQAERTGGLQGNSDIKNRNILFSYVNKCGWDSLLPSIDSVWFIYQHSGSGFMAYYYEDFLEMYNDGYLSAYNLALTKDRILMNGGYPQIYGSQIVGNSFYDIADEVNLNKRRKEMGMISIQERARKRGFEYDGPAIEIE